MYLLWASLPCNLISMHTRLNCCVCSLLLGLPDNVLECILRYLSPRDRWRLRLTSSQLRDSSVVCGAIRVVANTRDRGQVAESWRQDEDTARSLSRLPAVARLKLKPQSLYAYAQLACLQSSVRYVHLNDAPFLDLTPLRELHSLVALDIQRVPAHTGVGQLTKLTSLFLLESPTSPQVITLAPSLVALAASCSDAFYLPKLLGLTWLRLTGRPIKYAEDVLPDLLSELQGLKTLQLTSPAPLCVPDLRSLTELHVLRDTLLPHDPGGVWFQRGLKRLVIWGLECCPNLAAPSVTCLYLSVKGMQRLPNLSACSSLVCLRVQYTSSGQGEDQGLKIERSQLPSHKVQLDIWRSPMVSLEPGMHAVVVNKRFDVYKHS